MSKLKENNVDKRKLTATRQKIDVEYREVEQSNGNQLKVTELTQIGSDGLGNKEASTALHSDTRTFVQLRLSHQSCHPSVSFTCPCTESAPCSPITQLGLLLRDGLRLRSSQPFAGAPVCFTMQLPSGAPRLRRLAHPLGIVVQALLRASLWCALHWCLHTQAHTHTRTHRHTHTHTHKSTKNSWVKGGAQYLLFPRLGPAE